MAAVNITKRHTGKGPRWIVRFRLGGREARLQHAGTFPTEREARDRRDFCRTEIAAGRNPLTTLAERFTPAHRTLEEWASAFITARSIHVSHKTDRLYEHAKARIVKRFGARDPASITTGEIQEWIAEQTDIAPATVRHYASTFAQILDHAEVEPNPARSKRLRYPQPDREEINPPSRPEFDAILANLRNDYVLPFRVMEATGLRVGELRQLTWGDIDFASGRFRISASRTKGRSAGQRWLPVPAELLDEITDLLPHEDRARDSRVFPRMLEDSARKAIARACKHAGIADQNPHQLRHRRISLWYAQGVDPVTVKTWAGHTRASMGLDVYAHVMIDPLADPWRHFWLAKASEPRGRVVPVFPGTRGNG